MRKHKFKGGKHYSLYHHKLNDFFETVGVYYKKFVTLFHPHLNFSINPQLQSKIMNFMNLLQYLFNVSTMK